MLEDGIAALLHVVVECNRAWHDIFKDFCMHCPAGLRRQGARNTVVDIRKWLRGGKGKKNRDLEGALNEDIPAYFSRKS